MSTISSTFTFAHNRRLWQRTLWAMAAVWAIACLSDGRNPSTFGFAQEPTAKDVVETPVTPEADVPALTLPLESVSTGTTDSTTKTDSTNKVDATVTVDSSVKSESSPSSSPSSPPAFPPSPAKRGANKEDLDKILARKGRLTIKEASLADWMFTIIQVWNVDIHFDPAALQRETYSAQFTDTPLSEVLSTILTPKGLTYQRVANGLSIVPLDSISGIKPNQQTALIKLTYSNPAEIEPTLKVLMSPHGDTKIIPSSKTLVVIDLPENLAQIQKQVERLEQLARETHEHQQEELRRQREAESKTASSANAQNGANRSAVDTVAQTVTTVFVLRYVTASDIQEAVQNLVSDGLVSVVTKENMLVVTGTEAVVRSATQLVRQLDMPRKQVRISAILYDVSLDAMEQLGVNWRNAGKARIDANGSPNSLFDLNASTTTTGAAAGASTGTGTGTTGGTTTATTSTLPTSPFIASTTPNFIGSVLTVYNVSRNFDVSAILLALDQTDGARLLARPNTLVYDRRQASIKIITEIPVQQLTQTEAGGNIGTTTFREAGVNLQVTPEIADDGTVRLTVAPEFSALQGFQAGQPIIDRRTASTTVRVMSGDTLVLGGLRRRSEIETVQGIPGLMNIKYLGNLFRSHRTTVEETELIIFIQAEIVEPDYQGLFREQVAVQVTNDTLDHLPHASHAPFIPPCNDPYCPYHNPRPRIWQGNVLTPVGEWPDAAVPAYGYPDPSVGMPVVPSQVQPRYDGPPVTMPQNIAPLPPVQPAPPVQWTPPGPPAAPVPAAPIPANPLPPVPMPAAPFPVDPLPVAPVPAPGAALPNDNGPPPVFIDQAALRRSTMRRLPTVTLEPSRQLANKSGVPTRSEELSATGQSAADVAPATYSRQNPKAGTVPSTQKRTAMQKQGWRGNELRR